ncbi:hypothetical protein M9458_000414 [Cirrhinus mrigala]|uniref:Uncharacterized protein n=1 Tax=Cirrhinus mrigala TaxID=683832 RepID=A0ABD0RWG1_CIRMR
MADPCLQMSIIETAGALSAIGIPVLLLGVSFAFAYGALEENGLSLVFRELQCIGVFRSSLAVIALAALGRMAATGAVKFAGVDGVAAGALAVAAGVIVSAFMSAILAALIARSRRARLDTAVDNFITLMIPTAACGFLFGMGMSLLFGQRNRNTGGTNRGMDEDEDEDTEVNRQEKYERQRKKRRRKKKGNTT